MSKTARHAEQFGMECVGRKEGRTVFVSTDALAQVGRREVLESLGMTRRFPVVADLSGRVVMVEAETQGAAVRAYLERRKPCRCGGCADSGCPGGCDGKVA